MKITKMLVGSSVLAFVLSISLVSCGGGSNAKAELDKMLKEQEEAKNATQTVTSDSLSIEMDIPVSMVSTTELDAGVPFQYMNGSEEIYVIGNRENADVGKSALQYMDQFDESKKLDENYLNFTIGLMAENGTVLSNKSDIKKVKAKNAEGVMMRVDGKLTSIIYPITYWVASFETKGNVYKFIFWTLESQKEDVEKRALKAFESIKFK